MGSRHVRRPETLRPNSRRSPDDWRSLVERRLLRTELRMRPVDPNDLPEIYRWSTSPDVARVWMYRGATPSFDEFVAHLFASVTAQFVFERRDRAIAIGAIYDANFAAQRASIRLLVSPANASWMTGFDAFCRLAVHAFATFPLSRLYFQTNTIAVRQFERGIRTGLFVEEARLHNFERFGDEWADLIYLSTGRNLFLEPSARRVQVVFPSEGSDEG